jgi:GT2 family glycosyltransferase
MDLSLILVYYRAPEALRACLASLPAALADLRSEILIIDNASGDGMAEEIRRLHSGIQLIESPANEGFARGVNRGIRESTGRCVALLNPDTRVEAGAFAKLVAHLDAHPEVGVVGPRITDPDGTLQLSCRRFPTHWTGLFNRYSLFTRVFPSNPWSRAYLMLDFDHATTRSVDWISGACMVTRRAVIDRVGMLDEAFFLFNEDVDWCRRMHAAGFRVVYLPAATCTHMIGASKGPIPAWLIWRRHEGMRHYFRKHHPGPWPWMLLTDLGIYSRAALQVATQPLIAVGNAWRGSRARRAA